MGKAYIILDVNFDDYGNPIGRKFTNIFTYGMNYTTADAAKSAYEDWVLYKFGTESEETVLTTGGNLMQANKRIVTQYRYSSNSTTSRILNDNAGRLDDACAVCLQVSTYIQFKESQAAFAQYSETEINVDPTTGYVAETKAVEQYDPTGGIYYDTTPDSSTVNDDNGDGIYTTTPYMDREEVVNNRGEEAADYVLGDGWEEDEDGKIETGGTEAHFVPGTETVATLLRTRNLTKQTSDALEEYANVKQKSMQTFKTQLDLVNKKFNNNRSIYTMYLRFEVGQHILVDTSSQDWLENCLVSFTHEMNGSGQANQFTLEILFKPNDRNAIYNIMSIEEKLLVNCSIHDNTNNLKDLQNLVHNCKFKYGYGDDAQLRSSTYTGRIMDYSCKLENGNLRYTITGYCGIMGANEVRLTTKDEYLTRNGEEINDPLTFIQRIFEVEGEKLGYAVTFMDDCFNEDGTSIARYMGDEYKQFTSKNIFEIIKDLLAGCITVDQYNAMSEGKSIEPNQKQLFGFYVSSEINEYTQKTSDSSAKYGTVYIYKMESMYGEENADRTETNLTADCGITFNWFGPGNSSFSGGTDYNHIVLSWEPQFKGTTLLGLAVALQTKPEENYQTMDENGTLVDVMSMGSARNGLYGDSENNVLLGTIQEYSQWSFMTQYPYKATLTIIGVPCEVPMTALIKINANMMGNTEKFRHHSSGFYQVLSKKDSISSGGFTTTLELFKMTPGYNPKYLELSTEDNNITPTEINEDVLNSNTPYAMGNDPRYHFETNAMKDDPRYVNNIIPVEEPLEDYDEEEYEVAVEDEPYEESGY